MAEEPMPAPVPLARYLIEVLPNEELKWYELDVSRTGPPEPVPVTHVFRFERVLIQALAHLQREVLLGRIFAELDGRAARAAALQGQAARVAGMIGRR
jgi:hypothetical protein